MSEMIERVARQIFETNITVYLRLSMDFSEQTVSVQEQYRGLARAAIEAMREPTEAMEEAALDVRPLMLPDSPREVWGAMIDAALNEERQG